jgi:hypothetical protein
VKTLLVGDCGQQQAYQILDPDGQTEAEFEYVVVQALTCAYPKYRCVLFHGNFRYDNRTYRPDLALVARDYSHWFVVEVELVSHSLDGHVLPQIRAFQYGTPETDCVNVLAAELEIDRRQASTLIELVPRRVVVVANSRIEKWGIAFRALDVQMIAVSIYQSRFGTKAIEIDGTLDIFAENLGFGVYSATDRSIRFHGSLRLEEVVNLHDPLAAISTWTVRTTGQATWVTKEFGTPNIEDGARIQLIRTVDGRLSMRRF